MTEVQIGLARLIHGDSLELLKMLEADHIIGDPPYEAVLHEGAKDQRITRTDGRKMHGNLGFEGIDLVRAEVSRLCVQASRGWVILFALAEGVRAWRDDIQAAGGKWDTTLAWVKPDSSPRFNGQGAARGFECAVTAWCGKGHRSWNGGGKRGIYTHNVNAGRQGEHPTEKPVPLMKELVADFTRPGQTVLDPFMGSGSTGVACVQMGRKFIGIEQDPKWFDLACRRLREAQAQPSLFAEPPRKAVQQKLLG